MNPLNVYAAFAVYFVFGTYIALKAYKLTTNRFVDYFLADRTMGGVVAAFTYSATTYSTYMLVGLAGTTYAGGIGTLGFEFTYLVGLALAAFFGPRFWLAGKKYNFVTPYELIGDRYNSKALQCIVAIATIIFLIPFAAAQLMGIGLLAEGISGGSVPFVAGAIIAAIFAITWSYLGGMRAVAWTDTFQAIVMLAISIICVFAVAFIAFGGFANMIKILETDYPAWLSLPGPDRYWDIRVFAGLGIPWFFYCIATPHVSQRLFVTKTLKDLRTMLRGFMIFGFVYSIIAVFWGFSARILLPDLTNPDLATPALIGSKYVPPAIGILLLIGITAAATSTINSVILSLSSSISRDIFKYFNKDIDELKELSVGKVFIPIFTLAAFVFAMFKLDLIVFLSVATSACLVVVVPPLFGAFFWKKGTAAGAIAGIVVGGLLCVYLQFSGLNPLGLFPGIWSLIVSTVLFVIVSLLTKPPAEKAEEFLNYINSSLRERKAL